MKNNKKSKKEKMVKINKNVGVNNEEYGYDFVAELAHFTNIDEQRENAKKLEKL